jgi:transcriptional regulator GlxA family with amidase domain
VSVEKPRQVGILIFDEVEVLDFAGPFEVFSVSGRRNGRDLFRVVTVAETQAAITARGGLSVNPAHSIDDCPALDILVVPGGFGTRRVLENDALMGWVVQRVAEAELVLSVCTGALVLGKAGLLDGLDSTTHRSALELLREVAPRTRVHAERRIVDNGSIVIAAGVSAGIDAALYVVGRLHGQSCAVEAAGYMEYDWAEAHRSL